eukprot:3456871-Amphidinium_carterae.1
MMCAAENCSSKRRRLNHWTLLQHITMPNRCRQRSSHHELRVNFMKPIKAPFEARALPVLRAVCPILPARAPRALEASCRERVPALT